MSYTSQPYLPQAYIENDKDAANCYMLFQRLSYKLDLINTTVAHSYGLPEALYAEISDSSLVGVFEVSSIAHQRNHCDTTPVDAWHGFSRLCLVQAILNHLAEM